MRVMALYSIKGGVGKTAAAVNLAHEAARSGYRTLLWDMDPQAAATFYLRIEPRVKGGGKGIVAGKRELDDLVRASDFPGLDVLPGDFSYRALDLRLDREKKGVKRLGKRVQPLARAYDLLILDCPPSISLTSEAVFRMADALVVPVIPTPLSLRTYDQLDRFRRGEGLDDLALLPFLSMVDRRRALHRRIAADWPAEHPECLRTAMPNATDVEKMGEHRAPIRAFNRRSRAAAAYGALWRELDARLSD